MKQFQANEYKFVKYLNPDDDITEGEARQQAMYVLMISSIENICDLFLVLNVKKINVIIYL
jgi:hypothetical protein